jgi:hypothetical protein
VASWIYIITTIHETVPAETNEDEDVQGGQEGTHSEEELPVDEVRPTQRTAAVRELLTHPALQGTWTWTRGRSTMPPPSGRRAAPSAVMALHPLRHRGSVPPTACRRCCRLLLLLSSLASARSSGVLGFTAGPQICCARGHVGINHATRCVSGVRVE